MSAGIKNTGSAKLLYGWAFFAVTSLVFAGIFAFLVAMARTPIVQGLLPPGTNYVRVALVGHVNLAFVIWFLAFEGALWTFASTDFLRLPSFSPMLGWSGL